MKKIISTFLSLILVLTCLTAISLPTMAAEVPEGLSYSISDGEVTITFYEGTATELIIPATIEGYPVTSIGKFAFYGCQSLTGIIIRDGVTAISEGAFSECRYLSSVILPKTITTISEEAFYN